MGLCIYVHVHVCHPYNFMYNNEYCTCLQSLVAAGLGSGLTEGIVIAPFERVKVFMQAQKSKFSEVNNITITWYLQHVEELYNYLAKTIG